MSEPKSKRLRVLHLVSADGKSAPNPLLLPLLARGKRDRIDNHVLTFSIGDARLGVVRQSGLPVHEVALSRQRFSLGALSEAHKLVERLKPDLIHAWGATAQLAATLWLSKRGKDTIPAVWSIARTVPLSKHAGWFDKQKLSLNLKFASRCQRIVYPSVVAAANHRRVGLPEELDTVIAPGVDANRFCPDDAARERVRQQLELPKDAVLVGMYAPFAPESNHATFIKAVGELMRVNTNLYCVLAGRGTVKGNAALTSMLGGGVVGTRTRLVGEWTDLSALFNACDVVCSTAATDATRMTLAISMLCGTLCVATGVGAQGEVLGGFGASVEAGSIDGLVRGVRRILEMPAERKAFMTQAGRNHILQNFNMARSIEKFHELYIELVTGEAAAAAEKPEGKTLVADSPQAQQAAEVIARRAQATAVNLNKAPPKKEEAEEAPNESPSEFGTVEASNEPVRAIEEPASAAPTSEDSGARPRPSEHIDFEVLKVEKPRITLRTAPPPVEEPEQTDHWTDDDAKLMDEILVEADPETAKLNAAKAAAAEKAAAAKAAANAALTAALAGGDAAKSVDPKVLAAVLNINGGANRAAPRPVAGKPPPPAMPAAKVK